MVSFRAKKLGTKHTTKEVNEDVDPMYTLNMLKQHIPRIYKLVQEEYEMLLPGEKGKDLKGKERRKEGTWRVFDLELAKLMPKETWR